MSNKILILLMFFAIQLQSQTSLNQYFMDFNPNSISVNPGLNPDFKHYIGIPALSNINVGVSNSGFAFTNLFDDNGFTFDEFLNSLNDKNNLNIGFSQDILSFGFTVDSVNYFSFSSGLKSSLDFGYSSSLFEFIILGQGDAKFLGKTVSLDGNSINLSAYAETALGYNRVINDKLTVGGRFKILNGVVNLNGNTDGVSIYTDAEDFDVTIVSDFEINSSGISGGQIDPVANLGFGVDLGGSYKISDKLEVSASVLDLGYINWSNDTRKYYNDNATFTYEGVPYEEFNDSSRNYFEDLSDSIAGIFELKEDSNYTYRTTLPTRFIVGGKYQINNLFTVDGLYSGRFTKQKMFSTVVIGGSVKLRRILQARLSYSIINNTYSNFGAGFSINLGAFQIFMLADNLLGFSQIDYAKTLNASVGMNVVLGRGKKNEQKKKESEEE